jgi:hypothetical protein
LKIVSVGCESLVHVLSEELSGLVLDGFVCEEVVNLRDSDPTARLQELSPDGKDGNEVRSVGDCEAAPNSVDAHVELFELREVAESKLSV